MRDKAHYLKNIIKGNIQVFDGSWHHFVIADRKLELFTEQCAPNEIFDNKLFETKNMLFGYNGIEYITIPLNVIDKKNICIGTYHNINFLIHQNFYQNNWIDSSYFNRIDIYGGAINELKDYKKAAKFANAEEEIKKILDIPDLKFLQFDTLINGSKCRVEVIYEKADEFDYQDVYHNRIIFKFQDNISMDSLDFYLATIKNIFVFFFVAQDIYYDGIIVSNNSGLEANYVCDEILLKPFLRNTLFDFDFFDNECLSKLFEIIDLDLDLGFKFNDYNQARTFNYKSHQFAILAAGIDSNLNKPKKELYPSLKKTIKQLIEKYEAEEIKISDTLKNDIFSAFSRSTLYEKIENQYDKYENVIKKTFDFQLDIEKSIITRFVKLRNDIDHGNSYKLSHNDNKIFKTIMFLLYSAILEQAGLSQEKISIICDNFAPF